MGREVPQASLAAPACNSPIGLPMGAGFIPFRVTAGGV